MTEILMMAVLIGIGGTLTLMLCVAAVLRNLPESMPRAVLWRLVGDRRHVRWAVRYGRCYDGCGLCFDAIWWGIFGNEPDDKRVKEWLPRKPYSCKTSTARGK